LQTLPKSKLRYNAAALDPVLVAVWSGYRYFDAWQALTADEQGLLIAAYRTERGMQAYQSHEAVKGR